MARKKFKCSKCDRSFSMAAHLARHMGTIHASPRKKAAAKKKKRRAKRGRRTKGTVGRPKGVATRLGLRNMNLEQLGDLIDAARQEAQRQLAGFQGAFR